MKIFTFKGLCQQNILNKEDVSFATKTRKLSSKCNYLYYIYTNKNKCKHKARVTPYILYFTRR